MVVRNLLEKVQLIVSTSPFVIRSGPPNIFVNLRLIYMLVELDDRFIYPHSCSLLLLFLYVSLVEVDELQVVPQCRSCHYASGSMYLIISASSSWLTDPYHLLACVLGMSRYTRRSMLSPGYIYMLHKIRILPAGLPDGLKTDPQTGTAAWQNLLVFTGVLNFLRLVQSRYKYSMQTCLDLVSAHSSLFES